MNTTTESGIVVKDAPNYTLYRDTETFIRKHVLPIAAICHQCRASLVIDLPGDITYQPDNYDAEYYRLMKEYEAHAILYPSLEDYKPKPDPTKYHAPYLQIMCPVCQASLNITPAIADKVTDTQPILAYYKTRGKETPPTKPRPISPHIERIAIITLVIIVIIIAL